MLIHRVGAMVVVLGVLFSSDGVCAARAQSPQPLFESLDTLTLTIEAPFRRMINERERSSWYPASLSYRTAEGVERTITLTAGARGKSRLRAGICDFPGLMLRFPEDQVAGTLFDGQDLLPAVTHCDNNKSDYEQYLLLEYLIYRTYNVLTDLSLRVRLARVEYIDSDHERRVATKYAFFLEHWDDMAARTGWTRVRAPVIPPDELDAPQRNLFEVFQYMVGNTDWSYAFAAPDDSYCCHNSVPVGNPAGPVFPIPFDFDQAGVIDPPYATPSPTLPIQSVRQRLYRGICGPREQLDATFDTFRVQKDEIYALFENEQALSNRSRNRAHRYFDAFYKAIDDPRTVTRDFEGKCRTPG